MEPCGFVLSGPKDLELEEGTALPLQLNPFGQLISAHVLRAFSVSRFGAPRRVVRTAPVLEEEFR
jgi:hypothetical protein